MIKKLDKILDAFEILQVQLPAYEIESILINSRLIPALSDTVESIATSNENFYGYFFKEELVGVIAYEFSDQKIDITRLVIHPKYFRRKIASKLLLFIQNKYHENKINVSTGSKNLPAVQLYLKHGFHLLKELNVEEDLSITVFEWENVGTSMF